MPLIFDNNDNADIAAAVAEGGDIWYNKKLDRLKTKIKNHFLFDDVSQCCYCVRSFKGEFRMVIDIEHVLPQSSFATERFVVSNLNVACKRCNMEIKKSDTSFLVSIPTMGTNYYQSIHYKIIHPNLDNYTDHIVLKTLRSGNAIFIKYITKNSNKAEFTYKYFKLNDLEMDTINTAQGIKVGRFLSSNISETIRNSLLKLLIRI